MNLRSIANGSTRAIRPNNPVVWRRSNGYTQDPDTGQRTPAYIDVNIPANIQAVSSQELNMVLGMGIQGYHRALYINGSALGTMRNLMKGGDMFLFSGATWKATIVPEDWDDCGWSRVIVTLQQQGGTGADIPE